MASLLERWLDQLESASALIESRTATAQRLEGWIPWLEAAMGNDESARAELMRIVALDARNLAQEGRPASTVITQPLLLSTAWPEFSESALELSHLLVRVAADAHALGNAEVKDARQRILLARHSPIVPTPVGWLGYLIGPMVPDVIDGVFGRLLQAAATTAAAEVAVDVSGAEGPNPLFVRTLEGFAEADTGSVLRLTVTGVDGTELTQELARRSVPLHRVSVAALEDWLAGPSVNQS